MSMATTENLETSLPPSRRGDPAWGIARLFPLQGEWTEEAYLALDTNQLIELSDGFLEFLAMPTILHQFIVQYLFKMLDAHVVAPIVGFVLLAPLPVRLWKGKIREPDIVYLRPERVRDRRKPPEGADLAMEVVSDSPEDRKRDLETKKREYAQARIAEYWIVDPRERRITVLTLEGSDYRVHGEFLPGMRATSVLLPGFAVDVAAVFAAGDGLPETGQEINNGK